METSNKSTRSPLLPLKVPDRMSILFQIRFLVPLLCIAGVSGGVVALNVNFLMLDFFAIHRHPEIDPAEIHCETDDQAALFFCKQAAQDNLWWQSYVFAPLLGLVQVCLGPAIGILSDSFGRRPILVVTTLLQLLPTTSTCLYVWTGRCEFMWVSFALQALQDIPVMGVWLAYITDIVNEESGRPLAIALVGVIAGISGGIGFIVGVLIPVKMGFVVLFGLSALALSYLIVILPETLPPGKRVPLDWKMLAPWNSLGILATNELFVRLTAILMLSTFCQSGLSSVYTAYKTQLVGWGKTDTMEATVCGLVATLLWLGCFLRMIMPVLGEAGVLGLAQMSTIAYNFVFPLLIHTDQFVILEFLLRGPMALALPAISAIKSRLVPQSSQGHLQGAITTVNAALTGLSPVFWGALYQNWNYYKWEPWAQHLIGRPYFTHYGKAFVFWSACLCSMPAVWLIGRLPAKIVPIAIGHGAELQTVMGDRSPNVFEVLRSRSSSASSVSIGFRSEKQ